MKGSEGAVEMKFLVFEKGNELASQIDHYY